MGTAFDLARILGQVGREALVGRRLLARRGAAARRRGSVAESRNISRREVCFSKKLTFISLILFSMASAAGAGSANIRSHLISRQRMWQ